MTILDTMLAANAEFCAHPPADYTQEDVMVDYAITDTAGFVLTFNQNGLY